MNESKFDMQYSHYHFESAAFTIVYEVVKNNLMTIDKLSNKVL